MHLLVSSLRNNASLCIFFYLVTVVFPHHSEKELEQIKAEKDIKR